jgi:hypothetical protein
LYRKFPDGKIQKNNPSSYLIDYLEAQGVELPENLKNIQNYEPGVNLEDDLEQQKQNQITDEAVVDESDSSNGETTSTSASSQSIIFE